MCRAVAAIPGLDTPTAVLAADLPISQHHARIPCLHQQLRLMLVLHRDGAGYLPTEDEVRPGLTTAPDGRRFHLL